MHEPHVPIGRLDDGSPVFAPLGWLTRVDGGRRVICHACGDGFSHLSSAHLGRHGLTPVTYRQRYGLPARRGLMASSAAKVRAAEGARRYRRNDGVYAGLAAGRASIVSLSETSRAARVTALGFSSLPEYLQTRYLTERRGLGAIGRELGSSHRVVRRLLVACGVTIRPPVVARPVEAALQRTQAAD